MSHAPFEPPWWLPCPHPQTIWGSLLASTPHVDFRRERWDTPDGDFVDVDFVDGPEGSPWIHLYHGLEGSSRSPYARTLMAEVQRRHWRGSVFHFRGCSGEPNRLRRAYHSGDSDEIDWSLRRVKARAGAAPLYAAGVSLGGNALAKWLGERGEAAREVVARSVVVSAPFDLMQAGPQLGRGFSRVYGWKFLQTLKPTALAKLDRFDDMPYTAAQVRAATTLRDFDEVVTSRLHGFAGVDDYWTRASAKPHLGGIRVPTLLLNAVDDPFMPGTALPREHEVGEAVKLEFPANGGHVGFVTGPFPGHITWLPRRLAHFLETEQ